MADEQRAALYGQSLACVTRRPADPRRTISTHLFLLAALAMNIFPIAFPQITRDVAGTDLSDPSLRVRFTAFLRSAGSAPATRHLRALWRSLSARAPLAT